MTERDETKGLSRQAWDVAYGVKPKPEQEPTSIELRDVARPSLLTRIIRAVRGCDTGTGCRLLYQHRIAEIVGIIEGLLLWCMVVAVTLLILYIAR